MDYESAKASVLAKPEAVELHPAGPDVTSFKVCHKLFATLAEGEDGVPYINLKCDPNRAPARHLSSHSARTPHEQGALEHHRA